MSREYDVAVVGGGLLGSAIAWGLGRIGQRVCVLDEGDIAKRASRANFALVWVQSKGLGMPAYTRWTVHGARSWPRLAAELQEQTGLDVCLQQNGGFHITLSDQELEGRAEIFRKLRAQPGGVDYKIEILDHAQMKQMLPHIGPEVTGASFCPLDGHVNSLRTFRALHTGLARFGVEYRPEHAVSNIVYENGAFRLTTAQGDIAAGKIVLAAGNANQVLAPMVGLEAPMGPTRGQVIVTERTQPFLPHPVSTIRQTDEGTVMIGDSKEDLLDDTVTNKGITSVMADRAERMFPLLGRLNVVRSWSGIRVMPKDGFPIYEQSETCPGAFVACCHSGVTLAANHAYEIAPMIAAGALDETRLGAFTVKRFEKSEAKSSGYY
ncbi:FAD-dependent oxidoreductase [Paramesorhizobium deserti]|uniref:FAD-dependent oxidoreductase n=1 Tax=Paramesorhizobium deserti TaxID=1494590 RepID=A0A135HQJ1_9HYPH|nr:FAD-dependent oxidoreductase [Paramesorhizobium deserti]KXF75440.1 FAD-dependent oxidoreductase [Paramesorhizobium deserti]